MPDLLSWNEIRDRALLFAHDWKDESSEDAEAQTFWNEFFQAFGIRRRLVASFEEKVRNARGQYSYIDLFWSGKLLVEHKSEGRDLGKARSQAFQYIEDLIRDGRGREVPRYVLISDFKKFALYDLEPDEGALPGLRDAERITCAEFTLAQLPREVKQFSFIRGEKAVRLDPQDPANIEAAEMMGELHDALAVDGFTGHDLERTLVRILFCLFAEDTGIFEPQAFTNYIRTKTAEDGSDLGSKLDELFRTLNRPEDHRQRNLDEDLAAFPYVNGDLFAERLEFAAFNRKMRDALIECTEFKWEKISPAIFGSLFQGVLEPRERRQIGAHYTSERDILKVINSLFMDDLRAEFAVIRNNRALEAFHQRLASLTFFDPACGCGNFLVITYRELRLLELEVLRRLHNPDAHQYLDVKALIRLSVDQLYGIEIEEWPVRIAEVALWLMDHQMNQLVAQTYGNAVPSVPLRRSPHIANGNALQTDWATVITPERCSYILGNPPFVGKNKMNAAQGCDMTLVAGNVRSSGLLDYVTGWYFKASTFIQNTRIHVGFVSTNSICQGEQVGVLWTELFSRRIKIHFAHRTFPWESEARGRAHVHVVIIGFGAFDATNKRIYDYEASLENAAVSVVNNISPYLVEGRDWALSKARRPISPVAEIAFGSMPNDGGNLLLSNNEKIRLVDEEPGAEPYIRPFLGSEEFINDIQRWCIWLMNAEPSAISRLPKVMDRVEAVRAKRLESDRDTTQELAATPMLFGEIRQPTARYLAVPEVSSERRTYIPIGFLEPSTIASNKLYTVSGASLYEFGVIQSLMHMAWTRTVSGRLKSDIQYSGKIVYNNFPWPQPTAGQREAIEEAAQAVLDARASHPTSSLAQLYDPLLTPADLVSAHRDLDRAVDRSYRREAFPTERARVEYLFARYETVTAPLAPAPVATTRRPRRRQA